MDDILRILSIDPLPHEFNGPFVRLILEESHDGFENGRLSGAIGSKDGDDLPLLNFEGDPPDRHNQTIERLYIFNLKQCFSPLIPPLP